LLQRPSREEFEEAAGYGRGREWFDSAGYSCIKRKGGRPAAVLPPLSRELWNAKKRAYWARTQSVRVAKQRAYRARLRADASRVERVRQQVKRHRAKRRLDPAKLEADKQRHRDRYRRLKAANPHWYAALIAKMAEQKRERRRRAAGGAP
jgi:hypothetical protein